MKSIATFAGGCFWGLEEAFRQQKGVIHTRVGYAGGHAQNPSYEQVCHENTGHAEVVEVEFDTDMIDYETLLIIFWQNQYGPTQSREQDDHDWQYRSVVFYHDDKQQAAAIKKQEALKTNGQFPNKRDTQILPVTKFWMAEERHQQYISKNK